MQRAFPLLVLIALVAFSAGVFLATRGGGEAADIPGLLWPDPPPTAAFALTDAESRPFTREDLTGRWTFLFFGFTHCPDVCPAALATLKAVDERLEAHPVWQDRGQVVFVSVDPARDTPETLGAYVRHFNPAFRAATGEARALEALTRPLGVLHQRVDGGEADAYTIDHTASILLVDPAARLVGVFGLPHDAADIADRFTRIERFVEARS